jgi:hypothetical protein
MIFDFFPKSFQSGSKRRRTRRGKYRTRYSNLKPRLLIDFREYNFLDDGTLIPINELAKKFEAEKLKSILQTSQTPSGEVSTIDRVFLNLI